MKNIESTVLPKSLDGKKEKQLIDMLTAFSHTAQVPVSLFTEQLECIWECLEDRKICRLFHSVENCNPECPLNLKRAHTAAMTMKEPFVFLCASGLVMIAYPFITSGAVSGTILIGPIIMGLNWDSAIKKLVRNFPAFKDYAPEFISFLSQNQTKTALQVSYLYDVFCNCIFSSRLLEQNFTIVHDLLHAEHSAFPADSASSAANAGDDLIPADLLRAIRAGDSEAAQTAFTTIYERAYLANAGNQNKIRLFLLDLFHFLSTNIVSDIFTSDRWLETVDSLKKAILLTEMYQIAAMMVSQITGRTARPSYHGTSIVIKNAISFLYESYDQEISLSKLAEQIHVNPSYLSSLFKKETGMTFSQYLTNIRLTKSLDFLADTHYSITDISMLCGFSNQSYFIKTFKEFYHKTPGSYRKQIAKRL